MRLFWVIPVAALFVLNGCATIGDSIGRKFGQQLSGGILNHDDPETVAEGLPAYLLLLDGLNRGAKPSVERLCLAAELYSAYAGSFVADPARAQRLSQRSFDYAERALCAARPQDCGLRERPFDQVGAAAAAWQARDVALGYCYGAAWAGWIQTHAEDWSAIAAIPKARAALERVAALDPAHGGGQVQLYLGVMNSLLPPAVGGKPEIAKAYFDEALQRSGGRNQMVRVLYARHYARLVFDQELHDRLLAEVLAADPQAPDLTLINALARRQAEALQVSGKDYF